MVERGWIGVAIQNVNENVAESLGIEVSGALVADVTDGSPAEDAGLQVGDVIQSFGGTKIGEVRDLTTGVAEWDVGAKAEIVVWRDGEAVTLAITPALMETASAEIPAAQEEEVEPQVAALAVPELDLTVRKVDDVLVVDEGGDRSGDGVRAGDVIISVNQIDVYELADVTEIVGKAVEKERDNILMLIEREGRRQFVTVEIQDV